MGYTTKRKLKKQYDSLQASAELLLLSSNMLQSTLKSKIQKLEKSNEYLKEKLKRYDDQFAIDWQKMDEEVFNTGRRGRHSKPSEPRW
jgi:gas vesicle protein